MSHTTPTTAYGPAYPCDLLRITCDSCRHAADLEISSPSRVPESCPAFGSPAWAEIVPIMRQFDELLATAKRHGLRVEWTLPDSFVNYD
jgi:hypothetical protein